MKTYAEMLKLFMHYNQWNKNAIFTIHLLELDEIEFKAFKDSSEDDRDDKIIDYFNETLPAMEFEVSELCFAASNGYTDFFKVFDILPEAEKSKALRDNNGGLAFLFAVLRDRTEIVKILLKQKYIQEIINKPYKIPYPESLPMKFSITFNMADNFPFIEVPEMGKELDGKKNAKNEECDPTFSYGQYAYLLALKNNRECLQILDSLLNKSVYPSMTLKKAQMKSGAMIPAKLNYITQYVMSKNTHNDMQQTWSYDSKNKTASLICSSQYQFDYLKHHLEKLAESNDFTVEKGEMKWRDKKGIFHGKPFPVIFLFDVVHSKLQNCPAIPPLSWIIFCEKQLAAFTLEHNSLNGELPKRWNIKVCAEPDYFTYPFKNCVLNKGTDKKPKYVMGPYDPSYSADKILCFTAPIILARKSKEPSLKEENVKLNTVIHAQNVSSNTVLEEPKQPLLEALETLDEKDQPLPLIKSNVKSKKKKKSKNKKKSASSVQQTERENENNDGDDGSLESISHEDFASAASVSQMFPLENLHMPTKPLTEEEIKKIAEDKQRMEIEAQKMDIRDEIYFFPSKKDHYVIEKNRRIEELKKHFQKRALSALGILAELREDELRKQKVFNASAASLTKRDPSKGKIKTYDAKKIQIEKYLSDFDRILQDLKKNEGSFDLLFMENHIKILTLCDEENFEKARDLLNSLKTIFSDYDKANLELGSLDGFVEKLEKDLREGLSDSRRRQLEEEEARSDAEAAQKLEAIAEQEKERKLAIDAKQEEEKRQQELIERQKKREKWLAEQAAYEAQKTAEKLTEQQNREQNAVYAPLYSRKLFIKYRTKQSPAKEPLPLTLNAKAGNIEYRTKLVNELAHIEKILRLIHENKPNNLEQLTMERYAIRGALARIFEIIRHLQGNILPEKQAAALRIYFFKGPEFQPKETSDLKLNMELNESIIDMALKLLIHSRILSQKKLLSHAPSASNLLILSNSISCELLDTLTKKALVFMEHTKWHREFAPALSDILVSIEAGQKSLNEMKLSENAELAHFAKIFIYAHLGYHCALLRNHYHGVFKASAERQQYEEYIALGNAIRHEDSFPAKMMANKL